MTLVLDASAAMRLVVGGAGREAVEVAVNEADEVISPTLFSVEVANALWKHVKVGDFDTASAKERLKTALGLCDRQQDVSELVIEALGEAARLNHPVYDMIYLVTARRLDADLATADKRLAKVATALGIKTIG
jgi:predicted nucleic acid-binding protein